MQQTKRKNPYKLTIYVPEEKEDKVKEFLKMFKARNESGSQKILGFIENCVDNNVEINPQRRIHQYQKEKAKQKCFKCYREATREAEFTPTKRKYLVCEKHAKELEHHQKWRVVAKT